LVDDRSNDGTAQAALSVAATHGQGGRLRLLPGLALPEGWTGKVWAMEQGRLALAAGGQGQGQADGPPAFILFTDADIAHAPGSLRRLAAESLANGLVLNSRMARLRCVSETERLLIPPFLFFFNLMYPMRRVNDPGDPLAAAAGGCALVSWESLAKAGGLAPLAPCVIDDVHLARLLKKPGSPIRLALSRAEVSSLRAYEGLGPVWRMVRRSAFAELRYSWFRLVLALMALFLTFLLPPFCVFCALACFVLEAGAGLAGASPAGHLMAVGLLAWAMMALAYRPVVRFFGLAAFRAWSLPLAALLYAAMTLDSAIRHARTGTNPWR
jgi:hopene-associated glycosyltransferase HpnB